MASSFRIIPCGLRQCHLLKSLKKEATFVELKLLIEPRYDSSIMNQLFDRQTNRFVIFNTFSQINIAPKLLCIFLSISIRRDRVIEPIGNVRKMSAYNLISFRWTIVKVQRI